MKTSPNGIALICHFEGCKLEAYLDAAKPPVATIGYGHTGAGTTMGLKITQERAEQLLASDLLRFESAVTRLAVPLTQYQFDALVSFAFNAGTYALETSTLLRKLNAGRMDEAADEFLKWTRAGSVVLPGLVARRKAERAVFLGEITSQHSVTPGPPTSQVILTKDFA